MNDETGNGSNPNDEKIKKIFLFSGSVLVCLITGFAGSIFTITGPGSWYAESLVKPVLTPPGYLFGIVWTLLYILMGISLYLLLDSGFEKREVRSAVSFFIVQLVLNFSWSALFFGLKSPVAGMLCILALWIFILLTIMKSYTVSRPAAYLLIPYIAWVTFAACLNGMIVILN